MELGKCDYERGSDGKMVSVMTNKDICSVAHLENGWTAETILERISIAEPPRKALIDTGALITGLSNLEVSEVSHSMFDSCKTKTMMPMCRANF